MKGYVFMLVNSITCADNFKNKSTPINFKQGLTREMVTHVKNMPSDEYQRITHRLWKKYGMFADVNCSNTVAFCVEKTTDIMKRAGFSLPKYFKFVPLEAGTCGEFVHTGTVKINSKNVYFSDLEQLNKAEELNNNNNGSNYFLDTYLHEFLHSAHYSHIIEKFGKKKGAHLFEDELSQYKPTYTFRLSLLKFVKTLFPSISDKQFTALCPEKIKLHSVEDLLEYFAEKNALKLGNCLGENFDIDNIQQSMTESYKGFPENWNINNEIKKVVKIPYLKNITGGLLCPEKRDIRITDMLKDILNYFEGDIWNGNIDDIMQKCNAFGNYGKKTCK